ncbi:MAG: PIN domain-containing protein [Alphaproteobacteria bacterium]|nr:PIN domain-containing protein [Alphaproteobacteria bacterium]
MIYIDSSAALSQLMFESRSPPEALWKQPLVSSRLLEYEVWNRIHAYGLTATHGDDTRALLALVNFVELIKPALVRALRPFPVSVRTLDALHLATMDFLRSQGEAVELASYDSRLVAAAHALGMPAAAL